HWNNVPLRFGYALITLIGVCFAWAWFRAADVGSGWHITTMLLDLPAIAAGVPHLQTVQSLILAVFAMLVLIHGIFRNSGPVALFARLPAIWLGLLLGLLLASIVLSPGDNHAFIYFQF
ncbi:MAG: hypothetical protein ABIY56_03475, partial [Dokdonella sp.]